MEGVSYADSSFLVSLVCKDSRSADATAYVARTAEPLPFTPLHRIEVRNALRNAAGRKEITESERRAAFRQVEEDLRDELLIHMPIDWPAVFRRADELSEKHAATDGQRTIDLLHVAIALESQAKVFLLVRRAAAEAGEGGGVEGEALAHAICIGRIWSRLFHRENRPETSPPICCGSPWSPVPGPRRDARIVLCDSLGYVGRDADVESALWVLNHVNPIHLS